MILHESDHSQGICRYGGAENRLAAERRGFFFTRLIAASRSALTACPPIFGIAMTLLVCCKARGSAFWSSEWNSPTPDIRDRKWLEGSPRQDTGKSITSSDPTPQSSADFHVQQTGFCALCNGCGSSLGGHDIKVQRWSIRRNG